MTNPEGLQYQGVRECTRLCCYPSLTQMLACEHRERVLNEPLERQPWGLLTSDQDQLPADQTPVVQSIVNLSLPLASFLHLDFH